RLQRHLSATNRLQRVPELCVLLLCVTWNSAGGNRSVPLTIAKRRRPDNGTEGGTHRFGKPLSCRARQRDRTMASGPCGHVERGLRRRRQAPRAFTRPASLEIFRLAVFLCSTPLLTLRMISGCASRSAAWAAVASPEVSASSTFRMKV